MLWSLLACAAPQGAPPPRTLGTEALEGQLVVEGPVQSRVAHSDGASLVLHYAAEHQGSLDPCGCPDRPRGGMPRLVGYRQAAAEVSDTPSLLLHGGYYFEDAMGLDGELRGDVPTMNSWMVQGLRQARFGALNVAYNDLSGLRGLELEGLYAPGTTDLPLVSANVQGPGIAPSRTLETGDLRIAVTGITAPGVTFLQTPGFQIAPPTSARDTLQALREDHDLVVLLSYQAAGAAKVLAEAGLVDVVIDSDLHRTFEEPFRVGSAVWVRSHFQTMRLGELRLWVDEGQIVRAVDRKIDLDAAIPDSTVDAALARQARKDIEAVQASLVKP